LFALLVYVINSQDWASIAELSGAEGQFNIISAVSNQYTARIGQLMLTRYVLPFELISILLLVVLVGVIILSKKHLDREVTK
jgi:NADH-quinone oxidoreductase subunit J